MVIETILILRILRVLGHVNIPILKDWTNDIN